MAINQGAIQVIVTINGGSITIDKKNFLNLKIKRYIGDSANTFTLEAFDETAYALENLLMKNKQLAPIQVQYCSAKNMDSRIVFSGTCFNYQISFVGKGTLISITGVLSGADINSNRFWFEKANIEWVGELRFDEENRQWLIDGKGSKPGLTDEYYTDYITNENVCAVLKWGDDYIPASTSNNTTTTAHQYHNHTQYDTTSYKATTNSFFANEENGYTLLSIKAKELSDKVKTQCQAQNISSLYPIAMAIMMKESSGDYSINTDVFGIWKFISDEINEQPPTGVIPVELSVFEGVKHFAKCFELAGQNIDVAIQAYNTGEGFARWYKDNHYGERFDSNLVDSYKASTNQASKYTDKFYLNGVKQFYRVIEENVGGDDIDSNPENNPYNIPTVYYNPARIFKRILKTYRGEYAGSTEYSAYFKQGNVEDTQWITGLDINQTEETAAEYINRELTKNAMTVDSSAGANRYGANYLAQSVGFKYYVDANGHNFEHIDFSASPEYAPTITYGSNNSEIISFSTGKIGATAMTGNIYNDETGEFNMDEATLDDISTARFTVGGENVLGVKSDNAEETKKYKNWYSFQTSPTTLQSSSTESWFNARVNNTWYDLNTYTTTADMTVWGESGLKLKPGGFVNIIIYGQGMEHYSSGTYYITSMEDNISADGYTQTCKMIKNISNFNGKEVSNEFTGVDVYKDNDGTHITWTNTTTYSTGKKVITYTAASDLEIQYYKDYWNAYSDAYSNSSMGRMTGGRKELAAQDKARTTLDKRMYDSISEAKKRLLELETSRT